MASPISIADLRRLARRRLPRMVFDYLEGGAENENGIVGTSRRSGRSAHAAAPGGCQQAIDDGRVGRIVVVVRNLSLNALPTLNRPSPDAATLRHQRSTTPPPPTPTSLTNSPTSSSSPNPPTRHHVPTPPPQSSPPLSLKPDRSQRIFWPNGDIALARAAARAGVLSRFRRRRMRRSKMLLQSEDDCGFSSMSCIENSQWTWSGARRRRLQGADPDRRRSCQRET